MHAYHTVECVWHTALCARGCGTHTTLHALYLPSSPVLLPIHDSVPGPPSLRINPQTVREHSAFIIYSSPTHPNGDILHYTLTAAPIPASCHTQQQHELPARNRRVGLFTMYGLLPGVEYRVCVAAVNRAGEGQPACSTLRTKGGEERAC